LGEPLELVEVLKFILILWEPLYITGGSRTYMLLFEMTNLTNFFNQFKEFKKGLLGFLLNILFCEHANKSEKKKEKNKDYT
jgi:hypothetical protein